MMIQLELSIFSCVTEYLYKVNPHQVYSETGYLDMCTRHHANSSYLSGHPWAVSPTPHPHSSSISVPSALSNHSLAPSASTGTNNSVKEVFQEYQ